MTQVLQTKITAATWSFNKIIPVFTALLLKLNYRKKVFYFALNFLPVNFYQ